MATSLTSVVTTALRFSSAPRRFARAASVARRSLPQMSISNDSKLQRGRSRNCDSAKEERCAGRACRAVARNAIDLHAAPAANFGN